MNRITDTLQDLVWPEERPIDEGDRARAREVLADGVRSGSLTTDDAEARATALGEATRRRHLRGVLAGLDGGVAPTGLTTALRVATVVWLASTVIEVVVWLALAVATGDLDTPWWLWSGAAGGVLVGALHLANESYHRVPGRAAEPVSDRW